MSKLHPNTQKQVVNFLGDELEIVCSDEESQQYRELLKNKGKLPSNIKQSSEYPDYFYKTTSDEYESEDFQMLLQLRQTRYARTIKNCLVFITTLIAIGLALFFLGLISNSFR